MTILNSPDFVLNNDTSYYIDLIQNLINQNKTNITNELTSTFENLSQNQINAIQSGKDVNSNQTLNILDFTFDLLVKIFVKFFIFAIDSDLFVEP